MNLLLLIATLLILMTFLWLAQIAAVRWAGEGRIWVWPFRHGSDSAKIRGVMKAALGFGLIVLLVGYPILIGEYPWRYHLDKLTPLRWGLGLQTLGLVFGSLMLLFLVSVRIGWIRLEKRHGFATLAFKIAKGFWVPLPLTLMEEPLFRGIVLEQLHASGLGSFGSLVVSAMLFTVVHFLRPQKHPVLAAVGLFYVGMLLGTAYLASGHNYLLPVAIHAGGVMFIQVTRPISYYLGPSWLIGRSSYPIAGVLSMTAVTLAVTAVVVQLE